MRQRNWFTVRKILPQVFALAEFNHWEKVVSYLLIGKSKAILFDTGMGYGDIGKQIKEITTLPIEVYLTHSHWDHIGGINHFKKVFLFDDVFEIGAIKKGFNSGNINELTNKYLFKKPFLPKKYELKGKSNISLIKDKDSFLIDDLLVKVIHTPGHTPGSVCYFIPKLNVLVTGDLIYPGPLFAQLDESDFNDYIKSVFKIKKVINRNSVVLPGHNRTICDWKLLEEIFTSFEKLKRGQVIGEVNRENLEYKFNSFSIITNI